MNSIVKFTVLKEQRARLDDFLNSQVVLKTLDWNCAKLLRNGKKNVKTLVSCCIDYMISSKFQSDIAQSRLRKQNRAKQLLQQSAKHSPPQNSANPVTESDLNSATDGNEKSNVSEDAGGKTTQKAIDSETIPNSVVPKKRGRKPKCLISTIKVPANSDKIQKKRGRKPNKKHLNTDELPNKLNENAQVQESNQQEVQKKKETRGRKRKNEEIPAVDSSPKPVEKPIIETTSQVLSDKEKSINFIIIDENPKSSDEIQIKVEENEENSVTNERDSPENLKIVDVRSLFLNDFPATQSLLELDSPKLEMEATQSDIDEYSLEDSEINDAYSRNNETSPEISVNI
jgi:hypothetical protein